MEKYQGYSIWEFVKTLSKKRIKMIDDKILEKVIEDLKNYRPGLSKDTVRTIIQLTLSSGQEPISEIAQDIWYAYKKVTKCT